MEPTDTQLRNREVAVANNTAGLDQDTGVVAPVLSPSAISENVEPFAVPEGGVAPDGAEAAGLSFPDLIGFVQQPTAEEGAVAQTGGDILDVMSSLGEEGDRTRELEESTGFTASNERLTGLSSQIQARQLESANIPQQLQEQAKGRGVTEGGLAPLQAARTRTKSIEILTLAAEAAIVQGNVKIAQTRIDQALEAEFEPMRIKLDILKETYNQNKDALDRSDKKKSDAIALAIDERDRLLKIAENDKKAIYDIMKTAGEFGADVDVMKAIRESTNPEDALKAASGFISDPLARTQMEQAIANSKLTSKLNTIRINREAEELANWKRFGGMTAAQYATNARAENKIIADAEAKVQEATTKQEEQDVIDQAEADKSRAIATGLGTKISLLGNILDSKGLDTAVGPNLFARGGQRQDAGFLLPIIKGIGTTISLGTGGALADEATGSADDIVHMTEQFISQEFLDQLIAVKAKGATFGALQKAEQDALTSASTKIGAARIYDGKGDNREVIGYDMSEADFKQEINKIIGATTSTYEEAIGKSFLPDEQEQLDAYEDFYNQSFNISNMNSAGFFD